MHFRPTHMALFCGVIAAGPALTIASAQTRMPEPNPPSLTVPAQPSRAPEAPAGPAVTALPTREWTLHKTTDGLHPSDPEQQMVWLMNRARRSPEIEGIWLAHVRQSNVQSAMDYFAVNRTVLMNEFLARPATAPAAFDARLYVAASNHSAYLISVDGQNHSNQSLRITAAGFMFETAAGSVYSYAEDARYGHAGFNVDWGGNDGTGMQTGRGHRQGLMGSLSSVGIACLPEADPLTQVGPQVTTINYCSAQTAYSNHFNLFIVGTVWDDRNTNALYDSGEGLASVTVMPDKGTFYAVTGRAGGYAIPVSSNTYQLTFSGGAIPSNRVQTVTVGAASVLADCVLHDAPAASLPPLALTPGRTVTGTLAAQRKGAAYRLSTRTNLMTGSWTWAGVLPSGYGDTLTYQSPLVDTNAASRFLLLQGWQY